MSPTEPTPEEGAIVAQPPVAHLSPPESDTPERDREREEERDELAIRWARLGLPEHHAARDPKTLEKRGNWAEWGSVILEAAILSSPGQAGAVFLLGGPPGTGKTQLAVEVCRRLIFDHGKTCRYRRARDLLAECVRAQDSPGGAEAVLDAHAWCHLLALDEVDKVPSTITTSDRLHTLIDDRYTRGATTMLLGNWPDEEAMAEYIPETILDRSRQRGLIAWADWGSFRGGQDDDSQP